MAFELRLSMLLVILRQESDLSLPQAPTKGRKYTLRHIVAIT